MCSIIQTNKMSSTTKQKIRIKELDLSLIAPDSASKDKVAQGGSKTFIIGKPGCFKEGTPILMFNGTIKNVEDVVVGDKVMGDDGTVRNVVELCSNKEMMYDVVSYSLSSPEEILYTVNASHKLVVRSKDKADPIEITVTDYFKQSEAWKTSHFVYRSGEIALPNLNWTVSMYKLGLHNMLHLDPRYMISSVEQRLDLLAGVIDSSGSYSHKELAYMVDTRERQTIRTHITFLARSIGFHVDWVEERLRIRGNLTRIPTLVTKCQGGIEYDKDQHLIPFRVKTKKVGEYYGFTLDGNHRFLLGTFDVVRNTGKSFLISSLLYEKSHIFPSGIVMSGTEDSNHHYAQFFPSSFVYNKLDMDKITDFIKRQKISKQHLDNPWSVLLIDDCMDDPKAFNHPTFQGIMKNSRHYCMWTIVSLQYCLDVKPVIRTNIDGTFILREPSLRNRKALYDNYASIIPDFAMFNQIMDQLTTDYTALYINNRTTSNNIEDCVFYYKAKPVPKNFKFGSEDFWRFHYARYDDSKKESF